MESCILRTDRKGRFDVFDMFVDGQLIIALPHRASLTLVRRGNLLFVESDLGLTSLEYDLKTICFIDVAKDLYSEAVQMTPSFLGATKSFDCNAQTKRFVDYYNPAGSDISAGLFGKEMPDQVYVNLSRYPDNSAKTNIEFSVFREECVEMGNELLKLDEPAMTLVGSLKLHGQKPHYFMFVVWWGDDRWVYGKNFFFNNTVFPKQKGDNR